MKVTIVPSQVDISINDELVDINMKLDEHGAAFFVEEESDVDGEGEAIPPELATSPIPGGTINFDANSSSASR